MYLFPELCTVPSAIRPLNVPDELAQRRTRALDVGAGVGAGELAMALGGALGAALAGMLDASCISMSPPLLLLLLRMSAPYK